MDKLTAVPVTKQELSEILAETKYGIIYIEGPSACGKTYLLKQLRSSSDKEVRIYSYEKVVMEIMDCIISKDRNSHDYIANLKAPVVCVEDVDFLKGKEQTQLEFSMLAFKLSLEGLVIFTGIDLYERVPNIFKYMRNSHYYKLISA